MSGVERLYPAVSRPLQTYTYNNIYFDNYYQQI